jgi:hypothetical protein
MREPRDEVRRIAGVMLRKIGQQMLLAGMTAFRDNYHGNVEAGALTFGAALEHLHRSGMALLATVNRDVDEALREYGPEPAANDNLEQALQLLENVHELMTKAEPMVERLEKLVADDSDQSIDGMTAEAIKSATRWSWVVGDIDKARAACMKRGNELEHAKRAAAMAPATEDGPSS